MLATEPLAQPPGGMPVNRRVGRTDLPQDEVVRPAGQKPVEACHHIAQRQEPVTPRRQRAHTTADALDALCAALLRHGKAVASEGTVGLLSRLLPLLRKAFPRARFLVRLDGGFASPAVFDFLEAQPRLKYVVAMAKNAVLERHAEPAMLVARARSWCSEQTEHVYTDTDEYQAGTWNHARRVVIKAEVVRLGDREPRDNPRFVVTNLRQTPRFIYEKVYCARGDVENRIKELKALQIDRTSCQDFSANQLRVLLTAAAYVLMQELRLCAAGTACARAQVPWLRDRLLKLGVQVVRSVRRIVLHLPRATPDLAAWQHIAFALGARAG